MSGATMTPKEIVSELDKHIVGQDKAKKAVAIALRNRWRRSQVAEPLRQEITPKNILMSHSNLSASVSNACGNIHPFHLPSWPSSFDNHTHS